MEYGNAVRRRLGEAHVAGHDRAIELGAEVALQLGGDVLRERVARVVHGPQQPLDLERRIEMRAHLLDGLHEIRQPLERVVLALHRDQHRVGRAKAVQREQRQRRRAVEQDEIVVARYFGDRRAHLRERFGQRVLQAHLALGQIDELDLGAREVAVGGHEIEAAGRRCDPHLGDLSFAEQHLVDGRRERTLVDARAGGRVALGIEIDEQHTPLHRAEARREVDCRRRLADAALLVRDRDDARHAGSSTIKCRSASRPGTASVGAATRRIEAGSCAISSRG